MKSVTSLFLVKFLDAVHLGGHIGKKRINDRKGAHGFYNDNGSWHNNRVMTAVDLKRSFFSAVCDGILWLADGRGWFDRSAEDDLASVTHSTHNAAGVNSW